MNIKQMVRDCLLAESRIQSGTNEVYVLSQLCAQWEVSLSCFLEAGGKPDIWELLGFAAYPATEQEVLNTIKDLTCGEK